MSLALSHVSSTPPLFATETTNVVWKLSQSEILIPRCCFSKKTKQKLLYHKSLLGSPHAHTVLHAHTRQYQKQKSNFKHNLKSMCQSKSVTMTKQLSYYQTKETNRRFFLSNSAILSNCAITDAIFLVVLMRYFPKKTRDAMRLPSLIHNMCDVCRYVKFM